MRLKLILSRQNRFSLSARLEKTSLKTLTKRVVNRTDPFYFIDIIVIGNYDLWLENCIPKDLSLGIKGVLANLHFTITSCGECLLHYKI